MAAQTSVESQVGELQGEISGLNSRMDDMHRRLDDMHRLLMVLITVAGGGLITALVSLVLQLLK